MITKIKLPAVPQGLAIGAARSANRLSQKLKRGGGTTIGGLVLNCLRPTATSEMSKAISDGIILVSGTNGKTTTARLIRAALNACDFRVVANTAGSNLERGVSNALLDADKANIALFEVDEAALDGLMVKTKPRVVVLHNLFRDQLDRYGELELLVDRWHTAIAQLPTTTTVVYNADDPGITYIASKHAQTLTYGVDDPRTDRGGLPHASDSTHCRYCDTPLTYDMVTIAHLGRWSCNKCQRQRPKTDITATKVDLHGLAGQRLSAITPQGPTEISLRLPGLHNSYNALAAIACTSALELTLSDVSTTIAKRRAAFGRAEHIKVSNVRVTTLLAKNPAGANENIHTILLDSNLDLKGHIHLLLLLNNRTADGRDVSWIWDVDYELLLNCNRLTSLTIGGDRAYDMALRFRYAGLDTSRIKVLMPIPAAFDAAINSANTHGGLYVLPTYTALLELQELLTKRGLTTAFWEDT
ncbi:MAG: DUF1727 domain-containing protein [Acidimicrobiia bacterium]|nr:DUF1727 domain-containing protein [Acidimicrobiia bacterium]